MITAKVYIGVSKGYVSVGILESFGIRDPDSSRLWPSLLVPCMHSFIACKVIDGFPSVVCGLLMVLGPT